MDLRDDQKSADDLHIYILPNTLPKKYLQDIKSACIKNRFTLHEAFKQNETKIVVSNLEKIDELLKILKIKSLESIETVTYFVKLKWLTDCLKNGSLCDHTDSIYLINSKTVQINSKQNIIDNFVLPNYECQRLSPLKHPNENLSINLEILEEYAEFKATDSQLLKALAFRRAICVLKCLPIKIKNIKQLKRFKNIGEHITTILEDIIVNGQSSEVERVKSDDFYQAMKNLSKIYGCGIAISNRLYSLGFTNILSLRENHENVSRKIQSDIERLKYGITYYEDLTVNRVTLEESKSIFEMLSGLISNEIDRDCLIELTGGFRRGKQTGHDIDILITHPKKAEEVYILTKIIELLENKGLVIHGKHSRKSEHDWTKSNNHRDLFESYLCILKLPIYQNNKKLKNDLESENNLNKILTSLDASHFNRNWVARRCDLILCPIDQFPFAILGWTGSRQFNRSIRLYCDRELNYKLSSHGLFDNKNKTFIYAKTEKEIFDILKLNYIEPEQRNC